MLTALLTAIVLILAAFADKIFFAVIVLLIARAAAKMWLKISRRLKVAAAPYVATMSHTVARWSYTLTRIFGATRYV